MPKKKQPQQQQHQQQKQVQHYHSSQHLPTYQQQVQHILQDGQSSYDHKQQQQQQDEEDEEQQEQQYETIRRPMASHCESSFQTRQPQKSNELEVTVRTTETTASVFVVPGPSCSPSSSTSASNRGGGGSDSWSARQSRSYSSNSVNYSNSSGGSSHSRVKLTKISSSSSSSAIIKPLPLNSSRTVPVSRLFRGHDNNNADVLVAAAEADAAAHAKEEERAFQINHGTLSLASSRLQQFENNPATTTTTITTITKPVEHSYDYSSKNHSNGKKIPPPSIADTQINDGNSYDSAIQLNDDNIVQYNPISNDTSKHRSMQRFLTLRRTASSKTTKSNAPNSTSATMPHMDRDLFHNDEGSTSYHYNDGFPIHSLPITKDPNNTLDSRSVLAKNAAPGALGWSEQDNSSRLYLSNSSHRVVPQHSQPMDFKPTGYSINSHRSRSSDFENVNSLTIRNHEQQQITDPSTIFAKKKPIHTTSSTSNNSTESAKQSKDIENNDNTDSSHIHNNINDIIINNKIIHVDDSYTPDYNIIHPIRQPPHSFTEDGLTEMNHNNYHHYHQQQTPRFTSSWADTPVLPKPNPYHEHFNNHTVRDGSHIYNNDNQWLQQVAELPIHPPDVPSSQNENTRHLSYTQLQELQQQQNVVYVRSDPSQHGYQDLTGRFVEPSYPAVSSNFYHDSVHQHQLPFQHPDVAALEPPRPIPTSSSPHNRRVLHLPDLSPYDSQQYSDFSRFGGSSGDSGGQSGLVSTSHQFIHNNNSQLFTVPQTHQHVSLVHQSVITSPSHSTTPMYYHKPYQDIDTTMYSLTLQPPTPNGQALNVDENRTNTAVSDLENKDILASNMLTPSLSTAALYRSMTPRSSNLSISQPTTKSKPPRMSTIPDRICESNPTPYVLHEDQNKLVPSTSLPSGESYVSQKAIKDDEENISTSGATHYSPSTTDDFYEKYTTSDTTDRFAFFRLKQRGTPSTSSTSREQINKVKELTSGDSKITTTAALERVVPHLWILPTNQNTTTTPIPSKYSSRSNLLEIEKMRQPSTESVSEIKEYTISQRGANTPNAIAVVDKVDHFTPEGSHSFASHTIPNSASSGTFHEDLCVDHLVSQGIIALPLPDSIKKSSNKIEQKPTMGSFPTTTAVNNTTGTFRNSRIANNNIQDSCKDLEKTMGQPSIQLQKGVEHNDVVGGLVETNMVSSTSNENHPQDKNITSLGSMKNVPRTNTVLLSSKENDVGINTFIRVRSDPIGRRASEIMEPKSYLQSTPVASIVLSENSSSCPSSNDDKSHARTNNESRKPSFRSMGEKSSNNPDSLDVEDWPSMHDSSLGSENVSAFHPNLSGSVTELSSRNDNTTATEYYYHESSSIHESPRNTGTIHMHDADGTSKKSFQKDIVFHPDEIYSKSRIQPYVSTPPKKGKGHDLHMDIDTRVHGIKSIDNERETTMDGTNSVFSHSPRSWLTSPGSKTATTFSYTPFEGRDSNLDKVARTLSPTTSKDYESEDSIYDHRHLSPPTYSSNANHIPLDDNLCSSASVSTSLVALAVVTDDSSTHESSSRIHQTGHNSLNPMSSFGSSTTAGVPQKNDPEHLYGNRNNQKNQDPRDITFCPTPLHFVETTSSPSSPDYNPIYKVNNQASPSLSYPEDVSSSTTTTTNGKGSDFYRYAHKDRNSVPVLPTMHSYGTQQQKHPNEIMSTLNAVSQLSSKSTSIQTDPENNSYEQDNDDDDNDSDDEHDNDDDDDDDDDNDNEDNDDDEHDNDNEDNNDDEHDNDNEDNNDDDDPSTSQDSLIEILTTSHDVSVYSRTGSSSSFAEESQRSNCNSTDQNSITQSSNESIATAGKMRKYNQNDYTDRSRSSRSILEISEDNTLGNEEASLGFQFLRSSSSTSDNLIPPMDDVIKESELSESSDGLVLSHDDVDQPSSTKPVLDVIQSRSDRVKSAGNDKYRNTKDLQTNSNDPKESGWKSKTSNGIQDSSNEFGHNNESFFPTPVVTTRSDRSILTFLSCILLFIVIFATIFTVRYVIQSNSQVMSNTTLAPNSSPQMTPTSIPTLTASLTMPSTSPVVTVTMPSTSPVVTVPTYTGPPSWYMNSAIDSLQGSESGSRFGHIVATNSDGSTVAASERVRSRQKEFEYTMIIHVYKLDSVRNSWVEVGKGIELTESSVFSLSISYDGLVVAVGMSYSALVFTFDSKLQGWTLLGTRFVNPESPLKETLGVRKRNRRLDLENLVYNESIGVSVSISTDGNTIASGILSPPFTNNVSETSDGELIVSIASYNTASREWSGFTDILRRSGHFVHVSVVLSEDGRSLALSHLMVQSSIRQSIAEVFERIDMNSATIKWTHIGEILSFGRNQVDLSLSSPSEGYHHLAVSGGKNILAQVYRYNQVHNSWVLLGHYDSLGPAQSTSIDRWGLRVAMQRQDRVSVFDFDMYLTNWNQTGEITNPLFLPATGEANETSLDWNMQMTSDGMQVIVGLPSHNGSNGSDYGKIMFFTTAVQPPRFP